jgi:hypothetical protein
MLCVRVCTTDDCFCFPRCVNFKCCPCTARGKYAHPFVHCMILSFDSKLCCAIYYFVRLKTACIGEFATNEMVKILRSSRDASITPLYVEHVNAIVLVLIKSKCITRINSQRIPFGNCTRNSIIINI